MLPPLKYRAFTYIVPLLVIGVLLLLFYLVSPNGIDFITYTYAALYDTMHKCFPSIGTLAFVLFIAIPHFVVFGICYIASLKYASFIPSPKLYTGNTAELRKNILLLFATISVMLVLAEIVLRVVGIAPGQYVRSKWFSSVERVKVKDGFYADSLGIFRISPLAVSETRKRVALLNADKKAQNNDETESEEVYGTIYDIHQNYAGEQHTAFVSYAQALRQKQNKTDLDSAIIDYAFYAPYNYDGFRSIACKPYTDTTKKKILLIGDSFTWGHTATPLSSCFADQLLSKGYIVYNTGISGSDPAQYLAVAKKYIPLLKPDYVIVSFFMGNDVLFSINGKEISYFKREPKAFQPIHYSTNAGNLLACPLGDYFSTADSAYNFISTYYKIPADNAFNKFCSLSSVGTFFWMALHSLGKVSSKSKAYDWYWNAVESKYTKTPSCNVELKQIDSIAFANGSKPFTICIKDILSTKYGTRDKFPKLFEGLQVYTSPVPDDGYNNNDGHFNTAGHTQYTKYIEELISQSR